jgi:ABC-2 type transport system permease protein
MDGLAKIRRLGVKELQSLWSEKMLLLFVAITFTVMVYSAALGASREIHLAPIAFVDGDRSQLAERIFSAFYPPRFKAPERIAPNEEDRGLDGGLYTFVLDIPPDFERDVFAGKEPRLQVNIDATRMSQAFIGAGYIQAIASGEIEDFVRRRRGQSALPIALTTRVMFNPNLTGVWFGGVMAVLEHVTLLSIILTGAAVLREREHGTLEHLLAMPLTPFQIMAAKVWANGAVILLAAAISLVAVVRGALGVPIAGSLSLFLLGTFLYLFSTTSIGILLATVARSMPQLSLLMILVILPLHLLSGAVTPRESMPQAVQAVMFAVPTTHYVSLAQAILYRGAGLAVVWPQLAAIAGIGAAVFLLALARFRRAVSLA